MKIFISESQYKRLIESEEEQEVLEIPNLRIFGKDGDVAWNRLQKFLKSKGNPPYSIGGDLDLRNLEDEFYHIPHPDGELKIQSPNDFDTTKPLRLKNKGFIGGDMYVKLNVRFQKSKKTDNVGS